VKLLLRLSFPNEECAGCLSKRFGVAPENAINMLKLAYDMGYNVYGITFHVGS